MKSKDAGQGSVPRMPQDGEGYRQVIAAELPKGPKAAEIADPPAGWFRSKEFAEMVKKIYKNVRPIGSLATDPSQPSVQFKPKPPKAEESGTLVSIDPEKLQDILNDGMEQITELRAHMEQNRGMLLQDVAHGPHTAAWRPQEVISTGGFEEAQVAEMKDTCRRLGEGMEQAAMLLKTLGVKLQGLEREIRRRKGKGIDKPFSPLGEEEL